MTAQLNPRDDLHPARRLPAPCPFPRKGHAPRAWRMKAFRFACWADSIEMMSPHIASMLASAIHRSIFAILDAINASHAATAFDLGFALLLSEKLPKKAAEGRSDHLDMRRAMRLTILFHALVQPTQSGQRAVGTRPAAVAPVTADNTDSRRDFRDSTTNAGCGFDNPSRYRRQC
jgi:hypothetical protein